MAINDSPQMQVARLQNYIVENFSKPGEMIEGSAADNAIRLLKMAKARGFNPLKSKARNPINNEE